MRMTRLSSVIIAALAACLAAPAALAFGIGLQPTTVEMEVKPGERHRQVINIGNVHKEKTISLTLGLADWSLDENGQIELTPPGEHDSSAAEWVRFSPAFVTLKPGESQQIIVDMATPSRVDRSGDFRFALLASTVLPEKRGGQSGVWKKYQIASLFYLTVGNAKSNPTIKNSRVVEMADGSTDIQMRIENDGNAHARLEGEITVSADGAEPQNIPVGNLVVLHDSARNYSVALPEPLPEDADIEVRLENIFAPQNEGAVDTIAPYKIDPTLVKAELDETPNAAPLIQAGNDTDQQ